MACHYLNQWWPSSLRSFADIRPQGSKRTNADPVWRHQMESFSASLALCAGNPPATGEFPSQRPLTWCFAVSLICAWTSNRDAGNLGRHRAHYDVTVMFITNTNQSSPKIEMEYFCKKYISFSPKECNCLHQRGRLQWFKWTPGWANLRLDTRMSNSIPWSVE